MAVITNFDEIKVLRNKALIKGHGSKEWIEFAQAMFDSFPHIYATAQKMNEEQRRIRHAVRTLLGETEDSDYLTIDEQREMARNALKQPNQGS